MWNTGTIDDSVQSSEFFVTLFQSFSDIFFADNTSINGDHIIGVKLIVEFDVESDDSFRSFSYKSIDCRATQTLRQQTI